VAIGESIEFLFGLAAQPLVSDYDANVMQAVPRYAVAFDGSGMVIDHHDTRVGVERVRLERVGPHAYDVGLIAHERILPVWQGRIDWSPRSDDRVARTQRVY